MDQTWLNGQHNRNYNFIKITVIYVELQDLFLLKRLEKMSEDQESALN